MLFAMLLQFLVFDALFNSLLVLSSFTLVLLTTKATHVLLLFGTAAVQAVQQCGDG